MNYEALNPDKIVETIQQLAQRIRERFPDSGLFNVCVRLHEISAQAKQRSAWIDRPIYGLRIAAGLIIFLILLVSIAPLFLLQPDGEHMDEIVEFVQVLEPGINVVVLIGAAIFFLVTLEIRIKRSRALSAIHELRSVAHIIDMHQLTKDPERIGSRMVATSSSPKLDLKPFEMSRYLDYCSEMLSLTGKIAALYVQHFDDAVAIASANEVEQLCTSLARKMWQKIMILDRRSTEK